MCHSKELIFLYSAYTDRLILFYDIDNSYIIKTLRGDAHAAIRKIEGRMDMKKLRNCSILCCFTIAACGLGKSREADKLYINHRLIFEILLNNDCKVEAKKKGLVTVVLPDGESRPTVRVFPGVQDARLTAQKYNELTKSTDQKTEAKTTEISENSPGKYDGGGNRNCRDPCIHRTFELP